MVYNLHDAFHSRILAVRAYDIKKYNYRVVVPTCEYFGSVFTDGYKSFGTLFRNGWVKMNLLTLRYKPSNICLRVKFGGVLPPTITGTILIS